MMLTMNGRLSNRLNDLKETLDDVPNHDHLRTVRQSIVAQNKQDLLSLAQVVEHTSKKLSAQIDEKEYPELQELRGALVKLQERYTGLSVELKDVRSRCQQLSDTSRIEATETIVSKLETELMQLRVHLEVLGTNAKNNHAGLSDRLKYLKQEVLQLTTEDQQSLLREEVQQLVKTVADMVSRDEFLILSNQMTEGTADKLILQELQNQTSNKADHLQQRLDQLEHQLSTMTDSILEAVAETVDPLQPGVTGVATANPSIAQLEARLDATDEQLGRMTDSVLEAVSETLEGFQPGVADKNGQNPWVVDFAASGDQSNSRQALETLLSQAQDRLVLVWPWAEDMSLDESLLQQFRQVLERNCRLDIGWCHWGDNHGHPMLRSIDQRWHAGEGKQHQLKHAFNQLLSLKQDYENLFSFKILGTTENFVVCDTQVALIGMQALSTQSSLFPMANIKLRTTDTDVMQALIEQFETPTIKVDDTRAYFNRGVTRYDLCDFDGAVEDFTQVIQTLPSAAAYNRRGVARVETEDFGKALQDFGKAVRLDRHLFEAHCNRGALRITIRDYQGALSDFATATELQPANAIPYFYRGRALQLVEDLHGAVVQFGMAIERQPNLALPYCYRAVVSQQQGQVNQAIADLERAARLLRSSGDNTNLAQVLRKIDTLKQGPQFGTAAPA